MMGLLVGLGFAHARRTEPEARMFSSTVETPNQMETVTS